jgi:hypothetical protein
MLKAPEYTFAGYDESPPGALTATRQELIREYEKKKGEFNLAFSDLLKKEIHPSLLRFMEKVRSQGHHLDFDANTHRKFDQFLHRSFSIRLKGSPRPVVFTFTGNYDHRKVFVYTEFNETTTINVYELSMINEPVLERLILKGLGKIVS